MAKVHLKKNGGGFVIPLIELDMEAVVPGMDESDFQASAGPGIKLNARLVR